MAERKQKTTNRMKIKVVSKILTQKLIDLLKRQISHEITNMYKYQKIAMYLNIKGFTNLSNYYKKWSDEEKKHSIWVQEFLENLNIYVDYEVSAVESFSLEVPFSKLTELTLETELLTTKMLEECLSESYNIGNTSLASEFILNTMIKEQIEETAKANTINDQIKNIGENSALLQLFDNEFDD